jgi:DNA-binding NarL/FixJ family response regulator
MIRILIVDDHVAVRDGLRVVLKSHPNFQVVADASDGKEAILKAIEEKPDVAVIDYSLPYLNGLDVTRQIRRNLPKTEVLVFTMHDQETLVSELLHAGVRGFVLKSDPARHLIEAIEALAAHKPFFSPRISQALLHSFASARANNGGTVISSRERQVVKLIAEGHSNKATARMLDISLKTVETHRSAAMRKLELSSSAALVRYAIRNKLVEA